jgi:hypothetical protein
MLCFSDLFVYFCSHILYNKVRKNDEKAYSGRLDAMPFAESGGSGQPMVCTGKLYVERLVWSGGEVTRGSFP